MRIGFDKAWAGWRRRAAVCPGCGSDRGRHSRRRYEGLWPRVLGLRPAKCFECGSYFPIPARVSLRHSEPDPEDLHIPFTPLELEETPGGHAEGGSIFDDLKWWQRLRGACPVCRSSSVRIGRTPAGDLSIVRRLNLQDPYRCLVCNASFSRLNVMRFLALTTLLFVVLGGLSYMVISVLGGPRGSTASPRIKKDQIPPPPPPVFR